VSTLVQDLIVSIVALGAVTHRAAGARDVRVETVRWRLRVVHEVSGHTIHNSSREPDHCPWRTGTGDPIDGGSVAGN